MPIHGRKLHLHEQLLLLALRDDKGRTIKEAPPSTPVQVLGLNGVPEAGELFNGVKDEKDAIEIANMVIRVGKELQVQPHELSASLDKQSGTWPLLDFGLHIYTDYQRSLNVRGAYLHVLGDAGAESPSAATRKLSPLVTVRASSGHGSGHGPVVGGAMAGHVAGTLGPVDDDLLGVLGAPPPNEVLLVPLKILIHSRSIGQVVI